MKFKSKIELRIPHFRNEYCKFQELRLEFNIIYIKQEVESIRNE